MVVVSCGVIRRMIVVVSMDTSCCDGRCVVWSCQTDDWCCSWTLVVVTVVMSCGVIRRMIDVVDGRLVVVTVIMSCGVVRRMIGVVDGRLVVVMVILSCGVIKRMIYVVDGTSVPQYEVKSFNFYICPRPHPLRRHCTSDDHFLCQVSTLCSLCLSAHFLSAQQTSATSELN